MAWWRPCELLASKTVYSNWFVDLHPYNKFYWLTQFQLLMKLIPHVWRICLTGSETRSLTEILSHYCQPDITIVSCPFRQFDDHRNQYVVYKPSRQAMSYEYASVNYAVMSSHNDLSPHLCPPIIETNSDKLLTGPTSKVLGNKNQNIKLLRHGKFGNTVFNLVSIASRPQHGEFI